MLRLPQRSRRRLRLLQAHLQQLQFVRHRRLCGLRLRLQLRLQLGLRRNGRLRELLRHAVGKAARNHRQCVQLRRLLAQLRGLRLQRVHPCRRAGIADRFRAQAPGREVSGRADRVQVSRCVPCRRVKADVRTLHGLADQAGRVGDLRANQDHLSSGEAGCRRARALGRAHRGVPGCCRRYRRTKRLQRRSRASRSIREDQRSDSGRRWTSEKLRASASYTRRGNVQERGEQQRR